ncbi:Hypothetical protein POVN_LOCUS445 [uncultured virus]|nr:Hypothetical protein POVN_LOCUS445 [uncultured virus]
MRAWLAPNSRDAYKRQVSYEVLNDTSYAIDPAIGANLAMAYGNLHWKGVKTNFPQPKDGTVLMVEGPFVFYMHPSHPGVILIQRSDGMQFWASLDALGSWMNIASCDLDYGKNLEQLTTAFFELKHEVIKAVGNQLLTLRMVGGMPIEPRFLPVIFQPRSELDVRLLTALLPEELETFARSDDVSYVVNHKDDLRLINTASPYDTYSTGPTLREAEMAREGGWEPVPSAPLMALEKAPEPIVQPIVQPVMQPQLITGAPIFNTVTSSAPTDTTLYAIFAVMFWVLFVIFLVYWLYDYSKRYHLQYPWLGQDTALLVMFIIGFIGLTAYSVWISHQARRPPPVPPGLGALPRPTETSAAFLGILFGAVLFIVLFWLFINIIYKNE